MGAGASAAGGNAPPELRGPKKEARRMQSQVKEIGMSKDDLQLLITAFGLLPSYHDGTVRPQDIALLPQLAAVPLLGRVAMLYADEHGRLPMKELVNLVTEWSDVAHGGRAPATDPPGDGARPLARADRFRKVFDAYDADGSGTVAVTELVQLVAQLAGGGAADEPALERSLMQGPAAGGLSFEQFSQLVSSEELLTKTTVRIG